MEKAAVEFFDVKLLTNSDETPIEKVLVLTPAELDWWMSAPKTVKWIDNEGNELEAKLGASQRSKISCERTYRVTCGNKTYHVPVIDLVKNLDSMPKNADLTYFQLSDFVRR